MAVSGHRDFTKVTELNEVMLVDPHPTSLVLL